MDSSCLSNRCKTLHKVYLNRIRYEYNDENLKVYLTDNSIIDLLDIKNMITRFDPKRVDIINISSYKELNDIIRVLDVLNLSCKIRLQINSVDPESKKKYQSIKGLENRTRLDIDRIHHNCKINYCNTNDDQTEFSTWCHNLSEEKKIELYNSLNKSSKDRFMAEERVIKGFIEEIALFDKFFLKRSKNDQLLIIKDYIKNNYGIIRDDSCFGFNIDKDDYINNPVDVFRLKQGSVRGISNLITLVTNNNYLRINTTLAIGKKDHKKHYWNEVINDDKELLEFDVSNDLVGKCDLFKELGYSFERTYPITDSYRKKDNKIILKKTIR